MRMLLKLKHCISIYLIVQLLPMLLNGQRCAYKFLEYKCRL